MVQPFADRDRTATAFAEHVNRGKVVAYDALGLDIVMGERSGSWFSDAFEPERRWLNCHCNGGVFNLGHRNTRVVDAVRRGLDHLDVGNHHLVSGFRAELAARLSSSTGDRLPGVVFGVGGGEAIDLALKMARAHTGRQGVVSAVGGYHGHTGLSVAAGDPVAFAEATPGVVADHQSIEELGAGGRTVAVGHLDRSAADRRAGVVQPRCG